MLSDRSYMRDSYGRQTTSVLTWILCVLGTAFILENIFVRWISRDASNLFMQAVALSPSTFAGGRVWTIFTYGLLHDPDRLLHIVGNMLGLYFLGRELLPIVGSKRFVGLVVGAIVLGGLAWVGTHWHSGGELVGASAAVCALLVVFACLNPNQPITFLLFFILPVTLKPKYLAIGAFVFDAFGLLFLEIPGQGSGSIAHSAHLGGMLAGWIYFRHIHQREWRRPDNRAEIELPRWFRKTQQAPVAPTAYKVNLTSRDDLRIEVDRILDKINSDGFGSLTAEEKKLLDDARELLSRR